MNVWLPVVRAGSGADVYARRLEAALRARGAGVNVAWLPHLFELAPQLALLARPPPGASLIHGHSWSAFAFARFGLPLVVTVHSPIHLPEARAHKSPAQRLYHDLLIRSYERRSLAAADAVVAVSAAAAQATASAFPGIEPEVIHNFVDTDLFRPSAQPVPPARPFLLLFAGNRTPWKGWDLLPALMEQLGDGFHLSVAAGLRRDLAAGALPPRATSLGALRSEAEMVQAYQACDAVLVPSRLEGFGYVAAEAMACGKPVIAFDNTALPELVVDGRTGFLAPTGDVAALAAACRRLAADPALVARMGAAARERAVEHFSGPAAAARYLAVYERVLGRRARAAA